ncbi:uncharacterized protein LOC113240061 [Hyposmocoma kahamanoa]|uniref:uncharacterized protein LOC113240061 n=1 Tax=Hyposmocoma kahamanoa TaxID=1477025 RepID=UPI000E6D7BAC|nr:uncharacterized protein LOC113240061 [Hyposmocoma kahamanoa]
MAAYGLSCRFSPPPPCTRLLEPGAYEPDVRLCSKHVKSNRYPFLSNAPRNTMNVCKSYTDAIYDTAIPHRIPNCTSLMAKCPRFPYKAFSKKDLEEILCRCGLDNPCECHTGEEEEEIVCQGKVRRRLYIGPPPHSSLAGGISCPSRNDRGFDVMPDGSMRRSLNVVKEASPPFYDTRVNESTAFYQGCKWSKWTSQRSMKSLEVLPGPAHYHIEREIAAEEKCYEIIREYRRKTSKLVRSMENRRGPGPSDYSPQLPKRPELKYLGPKAKRFLSSKYDVRPSPARYSIKRDFDPPNIPFNPRYSTLPLPSPAGFGSKDTRLKYRVSCGPSPADYNANVKLCRILYCGSHNAPFNCSAKRFQDTEIGYEYDDEGEDSKSQSDDDDHPPILLKPRECPQLTCQFRSNTSRFKPLYKKLHEPSPADLGLDLLSKNHKEKSVMLQMVAPFTSSQGRFRRWHNWMPVHNVYGTPGPGYYNWDKPKCYPAVRCGPLFRTQRFNEKGDAMPAPNEYKVGGGVDDVLVTYNRRLLDNIKKQHKFHWELPVEPRQLDYKERELALLDKAIANLSTSDFMRKSDDPIPEPVQEEPKLKKQKLLRSLLYKKPIPYNI